MSLFKRCRTGQIPPWVGLAPLESRLLLAATVTGDISNVIANENDPATVIDLSNHFDDPAIDGTVVLFETVLGNYFTELFNATVPNTVANFLNYVSDGDYTNSFIHRSMPGFVIQGGGFTFDDQTGAVAVPTDAPVVNEFANWALVNGNGATVTMDSTTVQLPAGTDLSEVEPGNRLRLIGRSDFDIVAVDDNDDTVDVSPTTFDTTETGIEWLIFPDVNVRGTLSTPKLSGDPDSAASGFFVNLANTASNLDIQNEGFPVFGQVLFDGMDVVDAVAALQIINGGGAFANLPVIDFQGGTILKENLVIFNGVDVVEELSFGVFANDNPTLVTAAVDEQGLLTLDYAIDTTGLATITVKAIDLQGNSVVNTFNITVQTVQPDMVVLNNVDVKQVTYTEADGTEVKVTLKNGVATLTFLGDNLDQTPTKKGIHVTGQNVRLATIDTTGTTTKSKLIIAGKGGSDDSQVEIIDISADGDLKDILAKTTNLLGDINIFGALAKLTLFNIDAENTITVGEPITPNAKASLILNFNSAVDTSVDSAIGIKKIKVKQSWTDSAAADSFVTAITAPWIGSAAFGGDVLFDINLTGISAPKDVALSKFKTKTDILGGIWTIFTGDVGNITAHSVMPGWQGRFNNASVKSIKTANATSLDLEAASAKTISSKAAIHDSRIVLSEPFNPKGKALNKLSAKQAMQRVIVRTLANINNISAASFDDVRIYAGYALDLDDAIRLPVGSANFGAAIKKVALKAKNTAAFINSVLAGSTIGKASLKMMQFDNTSQEHGLAARFIGKFDGQTPGGTKVKLGKLDDQTATDALIAATSIDFVDFVLRIV